MLLTRSTWCLPVKRFHRVIALLALLLFLPALPSLAWDASGHNYANNLAVDCVPAELRPLYQANRAWIVRHSVDPDEWRRENFADESPRHFIDLDAPGVDTVRGYPHDYWVAVGLFGRAAVDRHGTAPWRIAEFYGKLVRAFRLRDARAVIEVSTWLGHYVSDVHVPFHATANYDGQSTGQRGIHARFEKSLVENLIKPDDLQPHPVEFIKDPVASAFQWAETSRSLCETILQADKRAILKDADFGYNYYVEFAITARPIAIRRLEQSAQDTASLWMSAWIEAGRPLFVEVADVHARDPIDKPTHDPDRPAAESGAERVTK